ASFLIMPMLALSVGVGSSRRRRTAQIAIGTVMLVIYNHALQFGGTLRASGRLSPLVALWLPFLLFGRFRARGFHAACRWPGEPALDRFIVWARGMLSGVVAIATGRARVRGAERQPAA